MVFSVVINFTARRKFGAITRFAANNVVRTTEVDDRPPLQVDTGHTQLAGLDAGTCIVIVKSETAFLWRVAEFVLYATSPLRERRKCLYGKVSPR